MSCAFVSMTRWLSCAATDSHQCDPNASFSCPSITLRRAKNHSLQRVGHDFPVPFNHQFICFIPPLLCRYAAYANCYRKVVLIALTRFWVGWKKSITFFTFFGSFIVKSHFDSFFPKCQKLRKIHEYDKHLVIVDRKHTHKRNIWDVWKFDFYCPACDE